MDKNKIVGQRIFAQYGIYPYMLSALAGRLQFSDNSSTTSTSARGSCLRKSKSQNWGLDGPQPSYFMTAHKAQLKCLDTLVGQALGFLHSS